MTERFSPRVVPIQEQRFLPLSDTSTTQVAVPCVDVLGRHLRDLRISVTDRCNFRCSYCMPKAVFGPDYQYLPHRDLLSFEEITRLARVFLTLGTQKIRLTGGEPLLRRGIETLIEQLSGLHTLNGRKPELTMTTNGALLARKAKALKAAGLSRITVSLDALDDTIFKRLNDVDFPVQSVLEGIEAAQQAGLGPVKVNMVVKRGVNESEIIPMFERFRGSGCVLRYIEFMDVGATNGWRMEDVLPSSEVVARIQTHAPLVALEPSHVGETAQRWGVANALGGHARNEGEIGVISSVTQAFCGDCNRARLSTEGRLFLCLFANQGIDLRQWLRSGCSDAALSSAIASAWTVRNDRYSEMRGAATLQRNANVGKGRIEMSYIGG